MAYYQKLERPVANESEAVQLRFGLTLQQIMDVVSETSNFLMNKLLAIVNYNKVFWYTILFIPPTQDYVGGKCSSSYV